jgi:hypothetical protein
VPYVVCPRCAAHTYSAAAYWSTVERCGACGTLLPPPRTAREGSRTSWAHVQPPPAQPVDTALRARRQLRAARSRRSAVAHEIASRATRAHGSLTTL